MTKREFEKQVKESRNMIFVALATEAAMLGGLLFPPGLSDTVFRNLTLIAAFVMIPGIWLFIDIWFRESRHLAKLGGMSLDEDVDLPPLGDDMRHRIKNLFRK